ncbi:MAG: NAD(P)H-dependent oxidoreductase [Clostridiaceae bacterium]|nr:NAD(P)H-dependent oxidoreductase [Clostridiaceae bacterium]
MASKIGVLVGSLRKESFSKKLLKTLKELAPDNIDLEYVEIGNLTLYNQDYDEGDPPIEYTKFREDMKKYQGFLFITPEYNRSVPAVIKNALDVGSRPYGKSIWNGKPGAVISVSPGALGGFGANHHLRQALVFLNVPTMQQPEAYIGDITDIMDEAGNIKDQSTLEYLKSIMESFASWVEIHKKA